ncbi:unannotated protein [freshwater metagenome]|uniref:Unannotated protein n=1 Tax=freshwater metagenome TaxID=449393 RepID=A0A6J6EZ24_9ZZZZ
MRESNGADFPLARGDEFSLISQVRRKEDGKRHLRDFTGLETDRTKLHPNCASTTGVVPETGNKREQKKPKTNNCERVPIALEITRPLHPPQREDERHNADCRPRCLGSCELFVEPGDDDIAQAVQQRHSRQQDWISTWREFANGEMGAHKQRDNCNEKRNDVGRNSRLRAKTGQHVCRTHDDNRHQHEA